ncbi:Oligopeptide transport ATP-binding protein OppD [compost metagenome]
MPTMDTDNEELYAIPGSPPDLLNPPSGDLFAARNPYALTADIHVEPPMFQVSPTHWAATWLLDPRSPKVAPPPAIAARHQYFQERRKNAVQQPILSGGVR